MRLITDYPRLNQKLVGNSYTFLRLGETIHHLESLQYSTALDLKMPYYSIRLLTAIQDMKTKITESGIFVYNCIPMDMCAFIDIFKEKVYKLPNVIEGVKKYIYGILLLRNKSSYNDIDQMKIIFARLRATGLKSNVPKCSFVLKYII